MRKLRESMLAKFAAWVICIASAMGCAVLGICVLAGMMDDSLRSSTRSEILKDAYESVNIDYSMDVINHLDFDKNNYGEYLRSQYFQCGIIESDSLKDINFHHRESYLETNLTDSELADLNPDQLYLCRVLRDDDGFRRYIPAGYYGDYEDIALLDGRELDSHYSTWKYLYADRICFDTVKGIIYYRAEDNYYPVQKVSLCYDGEDTRTIYEYQYDFDQKGYRLNEKRQEDGTVLAEQFASAEIEEAVREEESLLAEQVTEPTAQSTKTDPVEELLGGSKNTGSIVNLAALNDTKFNYRNWGKILLDDIRSIQGDELTLIDSDSLPPNRFISEPGYYLNEDFTLVVEKVKPRESYWVVSIVPDAVPELLEGSQYNQKGWLVDTYYDIAERNPLQGLVISVLVMLLSFAFLVYAAGHRRGAEGIVLGAIDRIPIDVFSIVILIVEIVLFYMGVYAAVEIGLPRYAKAGFGLLGVFAVVMAVLALAYVLSLCTRFKAGKWWRNSVCYRVFRWCRDGIGFIFGNVGLLWKIVLIIGGISVVELYILFRFNRGAVMMFWLLGKMLLCVVLSVLIVQLNELQKASQHMAEGNLAYKVNTAKMFWECRKHGENLNKINEGMTKAVDERMKSERLKTELITNVSHDIKTPLTSIINYVDLLSKEELHNDKAAEYLEVLDRQSSKLKKLIEDLVEASKASSGSLTVDSQQLEAGVFVTQTVGEFEEKAAAAGLDLIISKPDEPVYIMADGRHVWRVIDNLMNNICKYAQPGSRVYVNLEAAAFRVRITFRNISKYPLNISGEELMERFVRGDKSRNTEGHGLGLSIAQSLMKLIGGDMEIIVDGDLFKVILAFNQYVPAVPEIVEEKTID